MKIEPRTKNQRTYELRIFGAFLVLLVAYLLIARTVLAPHGFYGTTEEPRFADPWIPRAETILHGELLYRDVPTMTPPLANYLLVPPVLVSSWFGHQNPWATLSFMLYFSLFNLFAAYALLYMAEDRAKGYRAAVYFLFNPLTFGNSLLRRQDEPILVFFFALSLLFLVHRQHWKASSVIGLTLLVKLSGVLLAPIAFLRTRDWRYLVVPPLVFGLVFGPFLAAAGQAAIFWDVTKPNAEHPFQFGVLSLAYLWHHAYGGKPSTTLLIIYSAIFVISLILALALIARRSHGLFEDLSLLLTAVLLFSPKLHAGYFSLLVLVMAPLVQKYRITGIYFLFSLFVLLADMYKWPIEDFRVALYLMVSVSLLMIAAIVKIWWVPPRSHTLYQLVRASLGHR